MIDIRSFENSAAQSIGSNANNFIQERQRFIKNLIDHKGLIEKEYEFLQKGMNTKTEEAFTKKCTAWSKLINAIEILEDMYNMKEEA